jgi:hypothetical protein
MHKLVSLSLLIPALLLSACSDANLAAPTDRSVHPESWLVEHTAVLEESTVFNDCAGCHGADLSGSGGAVSCYSCHHPMDGSYRDGGQHGPEAKQDLTVCMPCHGDTEGPGAPRFNVGIDGNGCEGCHGSHLAHPQNWAGPGGTFHYSAGSIWEACTLCHGVDLDGRGGVGLNCLGCHESMIAYTLDCASCHGYPPDGSQHGGTVTGVYHLYVPLDYHDECSGCHGMSESAAGGGFEPLNNYSLFEKATDSIGDHWDGNIQINAETQYDEENFTCGNCHEYDAYYMMSDSGLPVDQKDME